MQGSPFDTGAWFDDAGFRHREFPSVAFALVAPSAYDCNIVYCVGSASAMWRNVVNLSTVWSF